MKTKGIGKKHVVTWRNETGGGKREREPSLFVDFLGIARQAHVANRGTQAPVLAVDLVYRPAVGAAKAAVESDTVMR